MDHSQLEAQSTESPKGDKAEKQKAKRVKQEWATHGALLVGKCQMHVACNALHKTSATVFDQLAAVNLKKKKKKVVGDSREGRLNY